MSMVSRVRRVLRRLIEDYGSSGSDEEKPEHSAGSYANSRKNSSDSRKSEGSRKVFFRPSGSTLRKLSSENADENSSSSSVDEEKGPVEDGESAVSSHMGGLIGHDHITDETASLDVVADDDKPETEGDERVRAFAHFPGNWATFVYLLPRIDGLKPVFYQLLSDVSKIPDLANPKWTPIDEPHISLSRTVTLRYHEIPQFTAMLKAEIKKAALPRFNFTLEDVEIYTNDQNNTSFLALKIGRGHEEVDHLRQIVDICLRAFNVPTYYENPEFHVSFAWCSSQDLSETTKHKTVEHLRENKWKTLQSSFADDLVHGVKAVHCRSGNRSYLVPL